MILPKHKLEQLDYYESKNGQGSECDKIILHWKSWYKFREVIQFDRICVWKRFDADLEDIISTYMESQDFTELKDQLFNYFKD